MHNPTNDTDLLIHIMHTSVNILQTHLILILVIAVSFKYFRFDQSRYTVHGFVDQFVRVSVSEHRFFSFDHITL